MRVPCPAQGGGGRQDTRYMGARGPRFACFAPNRARHWPSGRAGLESAPSGPDRSTRSDRTVPRPPLSRSRAMIVGVPREVKADEYRVGLLPVGAEMLVKRG